MTSKMLKENPARCPGCMAPLESENCPNCGYSLNSGYDMAYLRPGGTLNNGRYFVGRLAGCNGEGATYLGYDNQTNKTCWIREYFPTTLAERGISTGEIFPRNGYGAQYKALLSDFVDLLNEVKRFAVTEKVVPVLDTFSENHTCYAVYARMKILPLEDFLNRSGGSVPLKTAMDMLMPFFSMIGTIHDRGYIHRGISPHTVYVSESGSLYLWGFSLGAARTANSELEAELFNGYSAPEQYSPNGWQGTWTDVYALGALFYRMVSGFVPPKSTLVGDDRPVANLGGLMADVPQNISDAVASAMERQTENRMQTAFGFVSQLMGAEQSSTAVYDSHRVRRREREERSAKDGGFKYAILALVFTTVALFCGFLYMTKTFFPSMIDSSSESESVSGIVDLESPEESEPESSAPEKDVTVPRFVGQMLSVVQSDSAYKEKFEFSLQEEYNDDFPEGVIFKQSPDENTPMPNRGTVILYVSKGAKLETMPDIMGKPWDEALAALGEQNLSCQKIDRYVAGVAPDTVVGTSPTAGTRFDPKKEPIVVYVVPSASSEQSEASNPASSKSSKSSSSSSKSSKSSSSQKD